MRGRRGLGGRLAALGLMLAAPPSVAGGGPADASLPFAQARAPNYVRRSLDEAPDPIPWGDAAGGTTAPGGGGDAGSSGGGAAASSGGGGAAPGSGAAAPVGCGAAAPAGSATGTPIGGAAGAGGTPRPAGDAKPADPATNPALGSLSEPYEAGSRGSGAVGWDRTGGWSYGKSQIATKTGTMDDFLDYLKTNDPALSKKLTDAGGGQGASDHTPAFAKAWQDAADDGSLAPMEHGFIQSTHFNPQRDLLKGQGLDLSTRSKALNDVVWSVSVQHGADNAVATRALDTLVAAQQAKDKAAGVTRTREEIVRSLDDKDIINAIYDERGAKVDQDGKQVMKYFKKSTEEVQQSVADRFTSERADAEQELDAERVAATADKPPSCAGGQ